MKTTKTTVEMVVLQAADSMVLCNGETCTSIGGKVVAPGNADVSEWREMTPEEAEAVLAAAKEKESEAADV